MCTSGLLLIWMLIAAYIYNCVTSVYHYYEILSLLYIIYIIMLVWSWSAVNWYHILSYDQSYWSAAIYLCWTQWTHVKHQNMQQNYNYYWRLLYYYTMFMYCYCAQPCIDQEHFAYDMYWIMYYYYFWWCVILEYLRTSTAYTYIRTLWGI